MALRGIFNVRRVLAGGLVAVRRSYQDYRPDYYSALGISKSADLKTIKLAYYRMAKKYHPDNNQTDEANFMFRFVAEAYEVLSDEDSRKNYDMYGTGKATTGGMSSGPQRPSSHQNYSAEDLFNKIFTEAAKEGQNFKMGSEYNDKTYFGHDACHEFVADISFEQAMLGDNLLIPLNMKVICPRCDGTKSELGYQGNICPYCEGTGIETDRVGHVMTRKTCGYCDGSRIFIKYKCVECCGTGVMVYRFEHSVKIPPGCENGQLFRVPIDKKYMDVAAPGQNDHFFVKVLYDKSNYFKKDGVDIYTEADISVSQALLGGTVIVKGLWKDQLSVKIPPGGISSHNRVVVPCAGIPRADHQQPGDHFVNIGIKIPDPKDLTSKQLEIIQKLSILDRCENGVVDNGVETADDHKYRLSVVIPSKVDRNFASVKISEKAKFEADIEFAKSHVFE